MFNRNSTIPSYYLEQTFSQYMENKEGEKRSSYVEEYLNEKEERKNKILINVINVAYQYLLYKKYYTFSGIYAYTQQREILL